MEVIVSLIKYIFVIALAVEAMLILRALVNLAREKARPIAAPTAPAEE